MRSANSGLPVGESAVGERVVRCSPFMPSLGHSCAGFLMGLQALCIGLCATADRVEGP
jgi:hypothetical protein